MCNDVYVFVEQRDGYIQNVGIELLGEATRLAKKLGQRVGAVLVGEDIENKADFLCEYGADFVVVVQDPILKEYATEPYTKALTSVIKECKPEIMLFGATSIGRDLAPRVSCRIKTGLTADCTKLDIDPETKLMLMTRPAFGGNIMAVILCKTKRPQMATVRPGVMEALQRDKNREGEVRVIDVDFDENDMNIEILEVVKSEKATSDISGAKVLISGGRGIGGANGFEMLKDLADAFGSECSIAASRVPVDSGWIESDYQVGQTGKTVRPNLYIACGISGAIQHTVGMEGSDYIVAINKNETAPIFNVADLGIVGDVNAIIPKLSAAIDNYHKAKTVDAG